MGVCHCRLTLRSQHHHRCCLLEADQTPDTARAHDTRSNDMSFLFKSSKKGGPGPQPSNTPVSAPIPPVNRGLRSSDGGGPESQIPTLNGVAHHGSGSKPGSPTPGQGYNTSLDSVAKEGRGSGQRPQEDRIAALREDGARSAGPPSPEQKSLREGSRETSRDAVSTDVLTSMRERSVLGNSDANADMDTQQQRLPMQTRPGGDASPYPWSQRRLNFTVTHTNPFPRYGAAVNSTASKDGSIYLMGGLINGSTVKGDLWMVEGSSSSLTCFPVATTSEGPGPRVGHASLLVGNAFIVFGGDTKMDEGDMLDDTLYLLNTCE